MITLKVKKRWPRGRWKKYHSCCDWIYRSDKTNEEVMLCGLDHNRYEQMKKFEKYREIYY